MAFSVNDLVELERRITKASTTVDALVFKMTSEGAGAAAAEYANNLASVQSAQDSLSNPSTGALPMAIETRNGVLSLLSAADDYLREAISERDNLRGQVTQLRAENARLSGGGNTNPDVKPPPGGVVVNNPAPGMSTGAVAAIAVVLTAMGLGALWYFTSGPGAKPNPVSSPELAAGAT